MKSYNHGVFLFRTQLSLILLPVILFPLAFIGYVSYQISYHALQNRSAANVSQIASLVNQNLDTTLQQAIQLAKTPLYDTNIQQIVTYYAQHPELDFDHASLANIQAIENFSLNILIHNTNIDSVDIYTAGSAAFPESSIDLQSFENWTSLPTGWAPNIRWSYPLKRQRRTSPSMDARQTTFQFSSGTWAP